MPTYEEALRLDPDPAVRAEVVKTRNALIKSNLSNLAHAIVDAEEARRRAEIRHAARVKEIDEFLLRANATLPTETDEIDRLYAEVRRLGIKERD